MKKALVLLCLAILLCLTLASCEVHKMEKEIDDESRYALETAMETPQLQIEYEKDGARVFVYYLGRVSNVPLSAGAVLEHEKGKVGKAVYGKDDFDKAEFATLKSLAISRIIANDMASTVTYTDQDGNTSVVTVGSNPTVDYRYNIAEVRKAHTDATFAYAFDDSYTTVCAFVEEKRISDARLMYKTGIFQEDGCFRVTLFADCDLYAFATYHSATNTIALTYDLAVVESTLGFGTDESSEDAFAASDANKGSLQFDPSVLGSVDVVGDLRHYALTYVTNGGSFSGDPKLTYTVASATLSTPQKPFFDFVGWYFDEDLTLPATAETLRQRAADVTVYAKWSTQADEFIHDSFTALTSNIKGEEAGKISIAGIADEKIAAYSGEGYRARVTYYYTIGVPLEYEGTSDSSDLKIQLGFATDVSGANFIEMTQQYHGSVAPGSTSSHTLAFEASLSYFVDYCATVRLVVLSNDTAVLGICGRDAGTYSALTMVIEYIK